MALTDLLVFENPGVVAIAIGVLVFVLAFSMLKNNMGKGIGALISVILGSLSSYYLYRNWMYEPGYDQNVMAIILIILVGVLVARIFWEFVKGSKKRVVGY